MSDDDSDSDGSGGMTPEEAAEAQKWMSSWRLEMEGALAGASRAQQVKQEQRGYIKRLVRLTISLHLLWHKPLKNHHWAICAMSTCQNKPD